MFALFWPLILFITVLLYVLLIITLPFSSTWATMFLFAIISFWSRLPGVGMPSPFWVLYLTDFVDLFGVIIAINIGGIPAAIFTFVINIVSRACGTFPYWMGVLEDTIAQSIVCLIVPFVYASSGGDLVVTVVWYSVLRLIVNFPIYLIFPDPTPLPQFMVEVTVAGVALIAINTAYAQLFGGFLDTLLEGGVAFNWVLFLFVTAVIFFVKVNYFASPKKHKKVRGKGIDVKIRNWINLRLYLLKHSRSVRKLRKML